MNEYIYMYVHSLQNVHERWWKHWWGSASGSGSAADSSTPNDPDQEAPNKDGDEDERKPGKAHDLVTSGLKNDQLVSDSRIETRSATLQLPCMSSSVSKNYIMMFQGKSLKPKESGEAEALEHSVTMTFPIYNYKDVLSLILCSETFNK